MLLSVKLLLRAALLSFTFSAASETPDSSKSSGGGSESKQPCVGIDLGTTYSAVGFFKNGQVDIIANDQGNRITPSYVAFTDTERLIGDAAKNQATLNPKNTVFDVKRLIGRRYNDPTVQYDKKLLPFSIVNDGGKPMIEVLFKGEERRFAPEEVSSMILTKMTETAEAFLGESVKNAVVTVPAYFSDSQRSSTKDAGTIAGLNVLRIVNEPTAAAIAFGLDKGGDNSKILVFDFGGGTFDVSVLAISKGVFEVMATNGDTHLGGEDLDRRIMDHFVKVFKRKHKQDISGDLRAISKLRRECERAKRGLSNSMRQRVEIESLFDGIDFSETLTRAKFEELNADLFESTMKPVEKVLADSGLKPGEIEDVVMVGGSTRIPKVRELVKNMFGKDPHTEINPDEAVAYGAAVQSGILCGQGGDTKDLLLLDVTPLSMGIEVEGGVMSVIVKRNTVIPTKKSEFYTTVEDNQDTIDIEVFEGERAQVKLNRVLGKFEIGGLLPARKGVPSIKVTFEIDADGILQCTAQDEGTGNSETITITNDRERLSEADIQRMVEEAELHKDEDRVVRETQEARSELEHFAYSTKTLLLDNEKVKKKFSAGDLKTMLGAIQETSAWIEEADAKAESDEPATAESYKAQQSRLTEVIAPFTSKLYDGPNGGGGPSNGPAPSPGGAGGGDDDDDDDDEIGKGRTFAAHEEL